MDIRGYNWGSGGLPPPPGGMVWSPVAGVNLTVGKCKIDECIGQWVISRVIDGHGHQSRQHYENENSDIAPPHLSLPHVKFSSLTALPITTSLSTGGGWGITLPIRGVLQATRGHTTTGPCK